MRALLAILATTTLAAAGLATTGAADAAPSATTAPTDYVVLASSADGAATAAKAVTDAGGTVTSTNDSLGYVTARSTSGSFTTDVARAKGVVGAARNRVIGEAPDARAKADAVEKAVGRSGAAKAKPVKNAEPLAGLQWDMKQIDATVNGSYAKQPGKKGVLVGIIDTGVDGTHPDIAPNFDAKLSRNFTTDIPDIDDIDGACEHPESGCKDPANEDDDGHGTHVASTIGSPINGLGIAGVAPKVTLVNIRAGQDSGYFFLQPTLDALTYAGKIGVDVVNMSYYTDPWLYNCTANPADSPAEQAEQKVIIQATQRALNFARNRGVLPVAAEGNEATDLGNPTFDDTSPDYPVDAPKERTVDNSCLNVPAESKGVVTVSATGPSTRKSYYSNYGTEQTDVAAPGGDTYDNPEKTRQLAGAVLAAMPANVAEAEGVLNPDGTPNTPAVVQSCKGSGAKQVCGYYQYLQGTSMASPHAVGVAALIVSQYGHGGGKNIGLSPSVTESILLGTATEHACPTPRTYHYVRNLPDGTVSTADATCEGPKSDNGFYGQGIVNALRAVS
ncbi:S8 family peptidase [Spongisporangium articulatum]|uniref:S8 family peptidase n=1 Tax=Spongisporangium articulatum TaxID=3362603 RepID=A0ABW8ATB1_9ACTN